MHAYTTGTLNLVPLPRGLGTRLKFNKQASKMISLQNEVPHCNGDDIGICGIDGLGLASFGSSQPNLCRRNKMAPRFEFTKGPVSLAS